MVELYRDGAAAAALATPERAAFRRLAGAGAKNRAGLNRLLGEEPITGEDFTVRIPAAVLRSRGRTLALAARFERLLAGLYLSGVQSIVDPPTRLLIGRHLAGATRNLALVRGLRGPRLDLEPPRPLSVEYVGIQFDRYLAIPGA